MVVQSLGSRNQQAPAVGMNTEVVGALRPPWPADLGQIYRGSAEELGLAG